MRASCARVPRAFLVFQAAINDVSLYLKCRSGETMGNFFSIASMCSAMFRGINTGILFMQMWD